jgi:hypothetical protein
MKPGHYITVRDCTTPHRRDKPGGSLLLSYDRAR